MKSKNFNNYLTINKCDIVTTVPIGNSKNPRTFSIQV